MTTDERLALVVKAQVAAIRAEQARDRSALLERKAAPVNRALEAYDKLYGEDASPLDHFDVLMGLIVQNGGGDLTREDMLEAMTTYRERGDAEMEASDAIRALGVAVGGHRGTVLEWAGVDKATAERAVQDALKAS